MTIYNIPFSQSISNEIAKKVYKITNNPQELAKILIITPTKRSILTLREAFLRENNGKPTLLPRFVSLQDLEPEDVFWQSEKLTLANNVMDKTEQTMLLSHMVYKMGNGRYTMPSSVALAKLLGEIWHELTMFEKTADDIINIPPNNLAEHWLEVKEFLSILSIYFPKILAETGKISNAEYHYQKVKALVKSIESGYKNQIIALHITYKAPIYAKLLEAINKTENGMVVFQGIDFDMDIKQFNNLAEPSHPQYALSQMLKAINAKRVEINHLSNATYREDLANKTFLDNINSIIINQHPSINNIKKQIADNEQDEAEAIALAMREAIEQKQQTVALVTNDRSQARRVIHALKKFNINVNDSAGIKLEITPPAIFFMEIIRLLEEKFDINRLLSLLSSPYFYLELTKEEILLKSEKLDEILRGEVIAGENIEGIIETLNYKKAKKESYEIIIDDLINFLNKIKLALKPLENLYKKQKSTFKEFLIKHIKIAEELSANNKSPLYLYKYNDELNSGSALNSFLNSILPYADSLGEIYPYDYANIIANLMSDVNVNISYGFHPRAFIWGFIESRLQQADITIIGNLNENIFPTMPPHSPWINNSMRLSLGLQHIETPIGLAAHDFCRLISSKYTEDEKPGMHILLSRSKKQNSNDTVPSRFLQKLENACKVMNLEIKEADYIKILKKINNENNFKPIAEPKPNPHITTRPTRFSVTELDTLSKDSYSIYAKKVLQLNKMEGILSRPTSANTGTAIHKILEIYQEIDDKNNHTFKEIALDVLKPWANIPQIQVFTMPQIEKKAEEIESLLKLYPNGHSEYKTEFNINIDNIEITLVGKADYISKTENGYIVIDYKSGDIEKLSKSFQLPTIGYMIKKGAFLKLEKPYKIDKLIYESINLTKPMKSKEPNSEFNNDIEKNLTDLLYKYLHEPFTISNNIKNDYIHLSRKQEWETNGVEISIIDNINEDIEEDEINETH